MTVWRQLYAKVFFLERVCILATFYVVGNGKQYSSWHYGGFVSK